MSAFRAVLLDHSDSPPQWRGKELDIRLPGGHEFAIRAFDDGRLHIGMLEQDPDGPGSIDTDLHLEGDDAINAAAAIHEFLGSL